MERVAQLPDLALLWVGRLLRRKNQGLTPAAYERALEFYEPYLTKAGGFEKFLALPSRLPAPSSAPAVRSERVGDGLLARVRIQSTYRPRNPYVAARFTPENREFELQIRQHGPACDRPLVLCLHGFLMGGPGVTERMFKTEKLFGRGVDVAYFPWPFHGERNGGGRGRFFSEQDLLQPCDLPQSFEGICQAIHDLRAVLLTLKAMGYERVGLIGASLGAYLGALYATLDRDFDFLFMAVPALSMAPVLNPDEGALGFRPTRAIEARSRKLLELITPEKRKPRLSAAKISVVYHTGDLLAEARYTRSWARRWGVRDVRAVRGGHWAYFDRKARARAWYGLLEKAGYLA